jgi:hypothetical protein
MLNATTSDPTKTSIRQAAEDATVTVGISLVSSLIALGGNPSIVVLYATALPAVLVGLFTYAKARGIEHV